MYIIVTQHGAKLAELSRLQIKHGNDHMSNLFRSTNIQKIYGLNKSQIATFMYKV